MFSESNLPAIEIWFKSSEFAIFLSKSILESVQIAIEESAFPRYDSSGIGKTTFHNLPIIFPRLFI